MSSVSSRQRTMMKTLLAFKMIIPPPPNAVTRWELCRHFQMHPKIWRRDLVKIPYVLPTFSYREAVGQRLLHICNKDACFCAWSPGNRTPSLTWNRQERDNRVPLHRQHLTDRLMSVPPADLLWYQCLKMQEETPKCISLPLTKQATKKQP